jgi:hypothetical protein
MSERAKASLRSERTCANEEPVCNISDELKQAHCPWEFGYGCMKVDNWEEEEGPRVVCRCFASGAIDREDCWKYLSKRQEDGKNI